MARIGKNGLLSGALGNLVFVGKGGSQYVRSRPSGMKQTAATKAAAARFGEISSRDRIFRTFLKAHLGLVTDGQYASRHRAVMHRAGEAPAVTPHGKTVISFLYPEALRGFDFNNRLPWERCTRFFPVFFVSGSGTACAAIPALQWGKQIIPPPGSRQAVLKLTALSADPQAESMHMEILSEKQIELSVAQGAEAFEWEFDMPVQRGWVMVVGQLSFAPAFAGQPATELNAAVYLWTAAAAEQTP